MASNGRRTSSGDASATGGPRTSAADSCRPFAPTPSPSPSSSSSPDSDPPAGTLPNNSFAAPGSGSGGWESSCSSAVAPTAAWFHAGFGGGGAESTATASASGGTSVIGTSHSSAAAAGGADHSGASAGAGGVHSESTGAGAAAFHSDCSAAGAAAFHPGCSAAGAAAPQVCSCGCSGALEADQSGPERRELQSVSAASGTASASCFRASCQSEGADSACHSCTGSCGAADHASGGAACSSARVADAVGS